jgi:MFS family permease
MLATVRSLAALLCAAALLAAGGGLQTTLLALRGGIEGFPTWVLGLLLSSYSIGFMAGCLHLPRVIREVGHIRVFAALAAVTAAAALLYMLLIHPFAWIVLRAVNGFCLAGLSMVIESWLNDRAENASRARLLAVFRVVDLSAVTIGQLMLLIGNPAHHTLFAVISILVSAAVVPVALTRASAPARVMEIKLDLKRLYAVSPLAVATTFGVGLANAAYWALAPVFARGVGLTPHSIAWFMTAAIVAGALAQYPVGWLSDRTDRRGVLIGTTMLASLASLMLAYAGPSGTAWLYAAAAFYGCTAMPMYGLAVAHANDSARAGEFVRVSSGLLLSYAAGAVIGPLIAGVAMSNLGPEALFIYTGIVQAALVVFGLYRMTQRRSRPAAQRTGFAEVPGTSPQSLQLGSQSEAAPPAPLRNAG